jgi:hypothetical protein
LDIGDTRKAIFEGHRCKGRIFTFELIIKDLVVPGIEISDDNHANLTTDICTPHPSFSGFTICNIVLGYNSPLAILISDDVESKYFYPQRTKGSWTTVE